MSRWFRHYAGMVRDEKLVSVAIKSKQPIERVVWVWGAILESAAEIDDNGRYACDHAEIAYFLRADEADIRAIEDRLAEAARVDSGFVVNWGKRQCKSDRPPASEWAVIREKIFARDDFTCRYCGERGRKLQCDHVIPVSRGGEHRDDNLVTACEPCNRSKGAKLLSEWLQ
jgi:hypothetical protein